MTPTEAAAAIRDALEFEVANRHGTWAQTRRALLRSFEALGGLTVATSMVENNTRRPLDEHEFRGFALVDEVAPLVFVNTRQTLNGQLFTLVHEYAHVWRGVSGIGNESLRTDAQSDIERWCNEVASEVLVPRAALAPRYAEVDHLDLPDALDELARGFRCGTLVVLQALQRAGIRRFEDFPAAYDAEATRLQGLRRDRQGGGDHYNNQPFRIGERLSRAVIADTLEGRTSLEEAMRLMSVKSLSTFDEYARRLGAA
jgi:Zn-dependent peptidase ImmA (M78 family)